MTEAMVSMIPWDHFVQYISPATEHRGQTVALFRNNKKRHIQTHFKVKIVYMYSLVSKKRKNRERNGFICTVSSSGYGALNENRGEMHACTVYVK